MTLQRFQHCLAPFYQAQTFESELLGSPRCGRELLLNIELGLTRGNSIRLPIIAHVDFTRIQFDQLGHIPALQSPPAGWVFLDPGLNV